MQRVNEKYRQIPSLNTTASLQSDLSKFFASRDQAESLFRPASFGIDRAES